MDSPVVPVFSVPAHLSRTNDGNNQKLHSYDFGGAAVAALVKGNLAAEKVSIYLKQKKMSGVSEWSPHPVIALGRHETKPCMMMEGSELRAHHNRDRPFIRGRRSPADCLLHPSIPA